MTTIADSRVFKIWYRSLDEHGHMQAESSSLEEIQSLEYDMPVTFERCVQTLVTHEWEKLEDDSPVVIEGDQTYMPIDGESLPIRGVQMQCMVPLMHGPHNIVAGEFNNVRYIYECRGRIF